jgi:AraC-like DNA-binding protein
MGSSSHAFITLAHWERAHGSIAKLSRRLGFSSRNHFSRVFSAEFGCRPSDVRDRASIPEFNTAPINGKSAEATAKLELIASWLSDIRQQ